MRGSVRLHVRLVVWAPLGVIPIENLAISVDNLISDYKLGQYRGNLSINEGENLSS